MLPKTEEARETVAAVPSLRRAYDQLDSSNSARRLPQLRCEACSKSFVKKSGRRKRFCSDACRKAAQRAKEAPIRFQVESSVASGNALNRSYNSKGCRAKIENPYPSRFSVPLDLLGRGYRWPGAADIQPRLRGDILWCEGCAP